MKYIEIYQFTYHNVVGMILIYYFVFDCINMFFILITTYYMILFSYYLSNYTWTRFVSFSSLVKCNYLIGLGMVGMDRLVGNWHELIK